MAVGEVVAQVAEALSRAHALFDGASDAVPMAGRGLADASARTSATRGQVAALSGRAPTRYAGFATDAGTDLQALAGTDERVTTHVRDAGAVQRTGHGETGRVAAAGVDDAAWMAPVSGTPAGRQALLRALRDRVSQQQRLVAAYQVRAARMAALVRAVSYGSAESAHPSGGSPSVTGGTVVAAPSTGRPRRPGPLGMIQTASLRPDVVTPKGSLTVRSSPRDCAAALITHARRRGYSPARIVAMISTMLQESGGRPQAASPNGLWRGLFQQDSGYPGRDDPNVAISEFLDRLTAKGGQDSPDVWKTIFWLQQAPGAPSAEAAYTGGRRAYLSEIQSQLGRATALYRDLTA